MTLHVIAMTRMAKALELILSYLKNGRLNISNVELWDKFLKLLVSLNFKYLDRSHRKFLALPWKLRKSV